MCVFEKNSDDRGLVIYVQSEMSSLPLSPQPFIFYFKANMALMFFSLCVLENIASFYIEDRYFFMNFALIEYFIE